MIRNARHISFLAVVSFLVFTADAYSQNSKSHEFPYDVVYKNEIGINIAPFLPFFYTEAGLYDNTYLTFLQSLRYKRHIANNNILRLQFDYSPTVTDRYSKTGIPFFPYGMHNSILHQYDSTQVRINRYLESHYFGLSFGLEKQIVVKRFVNSIGIDFSIGADFVIIESRLDSVYINLRHTPIPITINNIEARTNSSTNIISGIYLVYELSYPIFRRLYISGQVGLGLNHVNGKDMQIIEGELDVVETKSSRFFIESKLKNNICLKYLF